jgi:hypothetical protein
VEPEILRIKASVTPDRFEHLQERIDIIVDKTSTPQFQAGQQAMIAYRAF